MELNQMLTWALSEATPSGDANMDMIMRKVFKYRAMEEGGRTISDFLGVGGDKMQDLERMNLELEILNKKKALGMDYTTTDEYERSINDGGKDTAVKGVLSKHSADIAEKHPFAAKNPQTLDAIFKEAFGIGDNSAASAMDRRKPVFKTAYNAVSSGKTHLASEGLLSKILGGKHGSRSSLFRYIR